MKSGRENQPTLLHSIQRPPALCVAGLWERWEKQDPALETCALITTTPNALMEPIHNRMPVILSEQSYASWLNPGLNNTVYLRGFLEPYNSEEMEAFPISTLVNNLRNDSA